MVLDKSEVNYALYLVTNNEMIPEGLTIFDQVEQAILGGVTVVQLREKDLDTGAFIERAAKLHELTKNYNVPLLINDRVDVALAIDAEGVHVGQDDMHFTKVRELIGDDKILGVSISSEQEALEVAQHSDVVDYIGIGPVYDTSTKKLTKLPFGPSGIRKVLTVLKDNNALSVKSVLIGGLNASNLKHVMFTSSVPGKSTDGVAVVSCIMAQRDARSAAADTLASFDNSGPRLEYLSGSFDPTRSSLQPTPLVHHITNDVVKNFSANVTLAVGGSPIMSELPEEFAEFANPGNALLLNTGTPTEDQIQMYLRAIKAYNAAEVPIVYDPVGGGASKARKACLQRLLDNGYFHIIKGNAGEIMAAAGIDVVMRGVDSGSDKGTNAVVAAATKLAISQRCVVVCTGAKDVVVNGMLKNDEGKISLGSNVTPQVVEITGGHPMMGSVTGSGCSLGSVLAAFIAVPDKPTFTKAVEAVLLYNEAGYRAANRSTGPGSFVPNFLDELYTLQKKPFDVTDITTSVRKVSGF